MYTDIKTNLIGAVLLVTEEEIAAAIFFIYFHQ
jgi:hypothetical protein